MPVLVHHATLGPFTGGYVGGDIFVVIGFYLITSILHGDLRKDQGGGESCAAVSQGQAFNFDDNYLSMPRARRVLGLETQRSRLR